MMNQVSAKNVEPLAAFRKGGSWKALLSVDQGDMDDDLYAFYLGIVFMVGLV
jgi:hypothetical protein